MSSISYKERIRSGYPLKTDSIREHYRSNLNMPTGSSHNFGQPTYGRGVGVEVAPVLTEVDLTYSDLPRLQAMSAKRRKRFLRRQRYRKRDRLYRKNRKRSKNCPFGNCRGFYYDNQKKLRDGLPGFDAESHAYFYPGKKPE